MANVKLPEHLRKVPRKVGFNKAQHDFVKGLHPSGSFALGVAVMLKKAGYRTPRNPKKK